MKWVSWNLSQGALQRDTFALLPRIEHAESVIDQMLDILFIWSPKRIALL